MRTPSSKALQSNILCRLAFFIALLPLLPSQAPHLVSAGIWELLRLLFVGIVISYGLFSSRNLDPYSGNDPPPPLKADAARSLASEVLHVLSPAFDADDEVELYGGKHQAWSLESTDEIKNTGRMDDGSAAALPSPIPWRSRSEKMEEISQKTKPAARSHSLPAAFDAADLLLPLRKHSPSPSISLPPEMRGKTNCSCSSAPPAMGEVAATIEESAREVDDKGVRGVGEEEDEEENEVDKKADEFIARFREEIRRQRIESIKSSTRRSSNNRRAL